MAHTMIVQDDRGWFFSNETGEWLTRKTGDKHLPGGETPQGTLVAVVVDGKVQPGFDGFPGKVAMMLARQAYPDAF